MDHINKLLDIEDINNIPFEQTMELFKLGYKLNTLVTYPTVIKRIILVAFENKSLTTVMGDTYFASLANTYGICKNYIQVCSPSLPNYVAVSSGTTLWNGTNKCGTDSLSPYTNNSENIFNLLSKAGLTWSGYAEDSTSLTNKCNNTGGSTSDARRHFPPEFYSNLLSTCTQHVFPVTDFINNYVNGTQTPTQSFIWITPSLCNDAHDCSLSTASGWLKNTLKLDTLLSKSWASETAFCIWFDEDSGTSPTYVAWLHPLSKGIASTTKYNNYNALATFEWLLGLGNCGNNDATAAPMKEFFSATPPPSCSVLSCSLTGCPTTAITPTSSVTLTLNPTGGQTPLSYVWTLDGTQVGTSQSVTLSNLASGSHSVVVTVKDSCTTPSQQSCSKTCAISVSQPSCPSLTCGLILG